MKYFDWMLQVMWHVWNQLAILFQSLYYEIYFIYSPMKIFYEICSQMSKQSRVTNNSEIKHSLYLCIIMFQVMWLVLARMQ